MKMEKLPMCRLCLVENVRMYVVVNKNLQELYEKLTDVPFVTEDSRPMLACFFCYSKLKQCWRLQRYCLEAEKLFAQMLNEDYEVKPLLDQGHSEFFSGYIISPTVHISISDKCPEESGHIIKENIPADCEGQDDTVEVKEEHQSESEQEFHDIEYLDSYSDQEDLPPQLESSTVPSHHSGSYSEDEVPLMKLKTTVEDEQEVSKKKLKAKKTTNLPPQLESSNVPSHHSGSYSEDEVPLMKLETTVEDEQEVSKKKLKAKKTTSAPAAKKPRLDLQKEKIENSISPKDKNNEKAHSKNTKQAIKNKSINSKRENAISSKTVIEGKPKVTNNTFCNIKDVVKTKSNENIALSHCTNVKKDEFKCKICNYKGINSSDIKRHSLRHNNVYAKVRKYKCKNSFCTPGHLKTHIRSHTGEKPYKCDICQNSFSTQGSLKIHIRSHTGEKPYKCDICLNSFSRQGQLKIHIRSHTGEKPYKCDICLRSFIVKSSLKDHISTHTGEKPYKCDICQKTFSHQGYLKKHIRSHTGEKPYKCDICLNSFSRLDHLKRHIRSHAGENTKTYLQMSQL